MTTTAALPMAWAPLEAALRQRRPVVVSYHAKQRLVCPHALGWKNDRPMLLAYQSGGETTTGTLPADPRKRWRCLFVDEVDSVAAADAASAWGTADNYNPSHPFHVIDEVTVAITPGGPSSAA
ncbi:MAG: WYL domain-containing protein [Actinobacteria bacterium]|nr:WYL domain-containing protein [Actinomycetota bacterium]